MKEFMNIPSPFVRSVSFPLFARKEGHRHLISAHRDLLRSQYYDGETIRALQFNKLKKLLIHAYKHTKFYRERFDAAGFNPAAFKSLEELPAIPVLKKSDIKENSSALIAGNFHPDQLFFALSGGTTGASLGFYKDQHSLGHHLAAQMRFDNWSGWSIGDWMGVIWPAVVDKRHAQASFRARIKNALYLRNIVLQQAVINEGDFEKFFRHLVSRKARAMRGFAFQLSESADYLIAKNVRLNSLKGVISTGEPLYPTQRQKIESAYGCNVFDSYRTREVGCVAQECEEHRGYHVNAESVLVETVSSVDQPNPPLVLPGAEGKILITDLCNYGMPFIRYEIGDIGIMSNRTCSCGRGLPLLEKIGGREADCLFTSDGKKVAPVTIIPNLFHLIGILNQFRIIQDRYDHITIQMVGPAPPENLLRKQRQAIAAILGSKMQVTYEYVDYIEPTCSGKYSFVVSEVNS